MLDTTQIAFTNIVENQAGVIDQLGDELALTLNQVRSYYLQLLFDSNFVYVACDNG